MDCHIVAVWPTAFGLAAAAAAEEANGGGLAEEVATEGSKDGCCGSDSGE